MAIELVDKIYSQPFGYGFDLKIYTDEWYIYFQCVSKLSRERIATVINFPEKISVNICYVTPGIAQSVDVNRISRLVLRELNKDLEKANGKKTGTS